jgi:hypothetical protein
MSVRKVIHDGQGGYLLEDARTLDEAQAQRLLYLRQRCSQQIAEAGVDEFDQINTGLGILEEERMVYVRTTVETARQLYHDRKATVEAATTNEAVDAVDWEDA